MHTLELGNNVPAFLTKLWKLVEDSKCDSLISWSTSGTSFIIRDQARFAKELLPLYFKHNNMASFIRQLNMYGFRKITSIENGGLRLDRDEMEFFHHYFRKGQEALLEYIKRKVPTGKASEETRMKPELLKEMLADVKVVQNKQESMDTLLNNIKRENETLWREVAMLRQKHQKQQHIVEKLIQFIVTLVQPSRNLGMKRKLPLMIHDGPSDDKRPHVTRQFSLDRRSDLDFTLSSSSQLDSGSPNGPVIHDVTDTGDSNESPSVNKTIPQRSSPKDVTLSPHMPTTCAEEDLPSSLGCPLINDTILEPLCVLDTLEPGITSLSVDNTLMPDSGSEAEVSSTTSPLDVVSSQTSHNIPSSELLEPSTSALTSTEVSTSCPAASPDNGMSVILGINKLSETSTKNPDSKNEKEDFQSSCSTNHMQVALSDPSSSLSTSLLRGSFTDYFEEMEGELDWLQDHLPNGFNIDPATLFGIFGADDSPFCNILYENSNENTVTGNEITGNELIQYTRTVLSETDENSLIPMVTTEACNVPIASTSTITSAIGSDSFTTDMSTRSLPPKASTVLSSVSKSSGARKRKVTSLKKKQNT